MKSMIARCLFLGMLLMASACAFLWWNAVTGWHAVANADDRFASEFRFLGCSDWPEDRPYTTSIQTSVSGAGTTYRIADPAGCGYSVENPRYKLSGDTLKLSYDLQTPTGELAACICEYKSEFRFRTNPDVQQVVFDHAER